MLVKRELFEKTRMTVSQETDALLFIKLQNIIGEHMESIMNDGQRISIEDIEISWNFRVLPDYNNLNTFYKLTEKEKEQIRNENDNNNLEHNTEK